MERRQELHEKAKNNPGGLRFQEFQQLLEQFSFVHRRTKGSHHIYKRPGLATLSIQPRKDGKAKEYQVKEFLDLVEKHSLTVGK